MESLAKRIRGHIEKNGPSTPAQITIGLDLDSSLKVSWSLGVMFRSGILNRSGSGNTFTYWIDRQVKEQVAKPKRTWAEYQAELQARKAARLARESQERVARAKAKEVKPKPVKVQPNVRKAFDTPIPPRARSVIEVQVAKPVLMTSQEWEAKGGKVEVLKTQWQSPSSLRRVHIPLY